VLSGVSAFIAGLIFGFGLLLSGMSNPAKVLGFLDLAGKWNPSLALVMVGAIAVASLGFALAKRRTSSFLKLSMQWPTASGLDKHLLIGSALFGIGWGLAGICPGPALVLLGAGSAKGVLFVLSMVAGMAIFEFILEGNKRPENHDDQAVAAE
jgi:uncharacterized membrane protein YedE/YeeE